MDWAWLVEEGLIDGDPNYYKSGEAKPEEVNHAIETAYLAANDTQRRKFVDMAWESGTMSGDKTYWYDRKESEVQDFATAFSGVSVTEGGTDQQQDRQRCEDSLLPAHEFNCTPTETTLLRPCPRSDRRSSRGRPFGVV